MANVQIPNLPAVANISGEEQIEAVQAGTSVRITANQIAGLVQVPDQPAGPTFSIQYNSYGNFAGSAGVTTNGSSRINLGIDSSTQGELRLNNTAAGSKYTSINSSNLNSQAWTLTLPTSSGASGYVLTTDGSGVSAWTDPTALGIDLDVGSTGITNGTTGRVLYDNAGVLGEYSSVPVSFGGTGKTSLTAHGILIGNTTGDVNVTTAGTQYQILQSSGASADPTWSTATYPSTATSTGTLLQADGTNWVKTTATYPGVATGTGTILRADGANWLATTATYPNTSAKGTVLAAGTANVIAGTAAPVLGDAGVTPGSLGLSGATSGVVTLKVSATAGTWDFTLPTSGGNSGSLLSTNGSGVSSWTTASFPSTATSTGTILRADGTNWVATTATYPATTTINQILYSSANNTIGEISTTNGGMMNASASGVPSMTVTPTLGVAGTSAGTLGLSGVTSGVVTLATKDAAGTWTMKLPDSGGSNGYILTTDGTGVTTWTNPTALGIDLDVGSTAITNGTAGRILYQGAGDVLQESANLTFSSSTLTLGVQQTTQGSLTLANTAAGAWPVTIQSSNSATAAWTLTLPVAAGSSGTLLTTTGSGVTAWTTAAFPSTAGTSGTVLQSNGTNWINSTATFPSTATSTGTILRADGTNWVATTATYPTTTTINRILYSSAANTIGEISTTNGGMMNASATGVPSMTITPTLGVASTSTGSLTFANSGSAFTTTIQAGVNTPANWTLTLPVAVPAGNGYVLTSTTGGATSWTAPSALSNILTVGTTATSGGASGQIMYDSGSVLQESSSLTWDNTNKLLTATGLGTGGSTTAGGLTVSGGSLSLSGNISANAWTTNGIRYKNVSATLTDLTSSGTVANAYTNVFGGNTIAASNVTTFTNYYTTYINDATAGSNVTITNKYSLGTQGNVNIGGSLTLGTVLSLSNGGTNANLTASNGGIVYSGASALAISAVGSSGQILRSGGAGAPTWSTATFPSTGGTSGTILRSDGTNWVNSSVTYVDTGTSGGIPYYSSTTAISSSALLTANALMIGGGAGVAPSTTSTAAGILTFLGTPSSANLAAAVTDETGSGSLVFGTSPTFTTSITDPLVIGGTGTTSTLTLRSTSGVGTTGADIIFQTGNNGATEVGRFLNGGNFGVGATSPGWILEASATGGAWNNSNGWSSTPSAITMTNNRAGGYDCVFLGRQTDSGGTAKNSLAIGMVGTGAWTAGNNASQISDLYIATRNASGGISERVRIDSSGNLLVGTTSAGTLLTVNGVATLCSGTATPAGGSTSARLLFGTTAGFGIYYGSGAPTVSAAQGSIYLRSDGSSTSTRLYVNTDGSTTWTNVTTAA